MHDGNRDHAVHPGLVYITFPTELGTLYSARELDELYQVCQRYDIPLYIDGARLGYGLMADGCDVTLPYLARHCDVFYIGGKRLVHFVVKRWSLPIAVLISISSVFRSSMVLS